MTTAEKVTLGVAVAGALGVGAVLKTLFDHFLGRRARKIDLAERSIRVADAAVSVAEAQLARTTSIIEALERELGELKAQAAKAPKSADTGQLSEILDRVVEANEELRRLSEVVHGRASNGSGVAFWRQSSALTPAAEASLQDLHDLVEGARKEALTERGRHVAHAILETEAGRKRING